MLKTRHLLFIFVPALLLAAFILFIRIAQYEPLYPKETMQTNKLEQNQVVPIYPEDPVIGNRSATSTIITFSDFGCAKCKSEMKTLAELMGKYPNKFKIVWKGLPIQRFPYSTDAAHQYAYCANQQRKFLEFTDQAFINIDDLSEANIKNFVTKIPLDDVKLKNCLNSELSKSYVEKNRQLALGLGIQVVPTVFVNNQQIQTPTLIEEWESVLNLK